jgi:N-acetylmuramoyl-L-alanine amidase
MRIVIDPGHGGKDPGAIGQKGTKEKDITLKVAITVASLLQQAGIATKLTRTSDVFVELDDRAKIANSFGANYFVSIHCNSATDRSARGIETYCYQFGGDGEKLAQSIQDELIKATGLTDRGVKAANFAVLRETKMPAVLTELAFISNPEEEKLLADTEFQDKCAMAIAKGIGKVIGVQIKDNKEVVDMLKDLVVYGNDIDKRAAEYLADYLACPIVRVDNYKSGMAKNVYAVGGLVRIDGAIALAGPDRYETLKEVLKLMKKL